ncbi:MAG: radical SAM protein [Actinobacteria bacterium]|nr:radical SAM protein [Actinomycetota bacterium]
MPSALPDGEPVPASGALPGPALAELGERPFGMYVHVPFCVTRCGYCDFNTYTDLGGLQGTYAHTAVEEVRLARRVLGERAPAVETVFVGGGTPTLLPPDDLAGVLQAVRDEFGLAEGAEVTTEANPDSVDARSLEQLRAAGFTRISFGMQSAVPHVLQVLDRTHTPGRPQQAVAEAHIVEDGTRLGRQVARGELPAPDDDALADRYLMAEEALDPLGWYEVSNWGAPCRHNLGYWRGGDWWGVGPGAHSHVGGVRWWNVKHPAAYAARLTARESPGAGRELLTAEDRRVERVLLEVRLRDGLDLDVLRPAGRAAAERFARDGLLQLTGDRAVLTLRGRLLADAVVRELVD